MADSSAAARTTLHLAGLPNHLQCGALRTACEQFGEVLSVIMQRSWRLHRFTGTAFVKFAEEKVAAAALDGIRTYASPFFACTADYSTSHNNPTVHTDPCKIYVGGLHRELTRETVLRQRFEQYGQIHAVKITRQRSTNRDGTKHWFHVWNDSGTFATLTFTDPKSAARAIEAEDGQEFLGRLIHVQYSTQNKKRCHRSHGRSSSRQVNSSFAECDPQTTYNIAQELYYNTQITLEQLKAVAVRASQEMVAVHPQDSSQYSYMDNEGSRAPSSESLASGNSAASEDFEMQQPPPPVPVYYPASANWSVPQVSYAPPPPPPPPPYYYTDYAPQPPRNFNPFAMQRPWPLWAPWAAPPPPQQQHVAHQLSPFAAEFRPQEPLKQTLPSERF